MVSTTCRDRTNEKLNRELMMKSLKSSLKRVGTN